MSSQLDLYINGTAIPLSDDSGMRLSRQLSDLREPEKRGATWSKTIRVPGSKETNKLLGHIYDIRHRIQGDPSASVNFGPDFNPNLKASAMIMVDGVEAVRGYARLLDIVLVGEQIIYEIAVASETKDLFVQLDGKKMRDLTSLAELNHTISRTNLINSWATSYERDGISTPFAYGEGYVYPLIDQGGSAALKKFYINSMRPSLALREIMLAIFNSAGYSWSSDSFLNTDLFKHLYIPQPGGEMVLSEAELLEREWRATRITTNQSLSYGTQLIMQDDSTGDNFDTSSSYNTTTGEWTVPVSGVYTYGLSGFLSAQFTSAAGRAVALFSVMVNGSQVDEIYSREFARSTSSQDVAIDYETTDLHLQQGDVVTVQFWGFADQNLVKINAGTVVSCSIKKDVTYMRVEAQPLSFMSGGTMDFTTFFDTEKTQRDFVLDIFKFFNLWATADPSQDKRIIIKPRNEMLTSTVLDWSHKIDHSDEIKITPLGELQDRRYLFTYADAGDIANQSYLSKYGRAYGQYLYTVNNDFLSSTREIKTGFNPTGLINYGQSWDAVLPWVEYQGGKTAISYRLLYYAGVKPCSQFTIFDSTVSGSASSTSVVYPFMGHVDDPKNPTLDLSWGMPKEVALALTPGSTYTNANLFNVYWRQQIEEISDPDSKIYTAKFRLTAADWQNLTLRELIFVSGEYFRINKIQDWDPINDGLSTVELIKSKTVPSFTAQTKRGGRGWDTSDGYGDPFPKLKKDVYSGGIQDGSGVLTGDTLGGPGVKIPYRGGWSVGSFDVIVLAPDVQVLNSRGLRILQGAQGSTVIDCSDITITEPGMYYQNRKLSANYLEGGGTHVISTSSESILGDCGLIILDCSAGDRDAVLPPADQYEGRRIHVIKSGPGGTATLDASGSGTIESVASVELVDRVTLMSDGSQWWRVVKEPGAASVSGSYNVNISGGDFEGAGPVITFL